MTFFAYNASPGYDPGAQFVVEIAPSPSPRLPPKACSPPLASILHAAHRPKINPRYSQHSLVREKPSCGVVLDFLAPLRSWQQDDRMAQYFNQDDLNLRDPLTLPSVGRQDDFQRG